MRQATAECYAGSGIKNGMRIVRLIHKTDILEGNRIVSESKTPGDLARHIKNFLTEHTVENIRSLLA